MNPVRHRWDFDVDAPLRRVWAAVSDTDRFNHAAGLGFRFEERVAEDGRVERIGRLRKLGVPVTWRELPFVIEAPRRWVSTRLFVGGPVARSRVTCELTPRGDRTAFRYTLELTPRHGLLRPLVALDTALSTRPVLDRTLRALVEQLEGEGGRYDPPVAPLSAAGRERLVALDGIGPPPIVDALRQALESAPLREQDRLRPLAFSRRLGTDPDATALAFVEAARRGVLALRWELLCPSCRAPKGALTSLELGVQQHCASCDIVYDTSIADSVEAVFRPHPAVREVQVQVECLLSPARTPHVVGQVQLEADARLAWALDLEPGAYRLSTGPLTPGASLEVREGLAEDRVTIDVGAQALTPGVLRVGPGTVRLHLRSRRDDPVWLRLERRERDRDVLTAGRLLEMPEAGELLPEGALRPGVEVAARRQTVLVREDVRRRGATWGGTVTRGDRVRVQRFDRFADALARAEQLAGSGDTLALAVGVVATLTQGEQQVPSGRVVDEALRAVRVVGAERIALVAGCRDDDEVVAALAEAQVALGPEVQGTHLVRFASAGPAPALAEPPPTHDLAGTQLGPYRLGQELARGGMGRVVAGTDADGRDVVVKLLLPGLAERSDHAQRFYNEARITAAIEHPNVVRVLDYGTFDGQLYLVMERLVGRELADVELPLPAPRVVALGLDVLAGLEAAHAQGVVHRDLKPTNLFLLDDGRVKIIDFGIAVRLDKDDPSELTELLGTPRYMSPEQVERDPIDARSDLYSLALVLYECLAGDGPFAGPTPLTLAFARVRQPPAPLPDAVDAELARVILRALELDPPRRFDDAAAMRTALQALALASG